MGGTLAIWVGLTLALAFADSGLARMQVLGNVQGTPFLRVCAPSVACTYLPVDDGRNQPFLKIPFAGAITAFSVNSGSVGGTVTLRVLRRVGATSQYTAVGSSAAGSLSMGVVTFAASLPVQPGDALALDNDSGALLFDTSGIYISTRYFQPALSDGTTRAPEWGFDGLPLFSATLESTPARIRAFSQSNPVWRLTKRRGPGAPRGTSFTLDVDESVNAVLTFSRVRPGHSVVVGTVMRRGLRPGSTTIRFDGTLSNGRRLVPGRYRVLAGVTNVPGDHTKSAKLEFRVVR